MGALAVVGIFVALAVMTVLIYKGAASGDSDDSLRTNCFGHQWNEHWRNNEQRMDRSGNFVWRNGSAFYIWRNSEPFVCRKRSN